MGVNEPDSSGLVPAINGFVRGVEHGDGRHKGVHDV